MPNSRVRIEQGVVPPDRMPGGETSGPQRAAVGQQTVAPPGSDTGVRRGHLFLYPGDHSITHNTSGNPITLLSLASLNAGFNQIIFSYPGGGSDRNDTSWVIALPTDVAALPNFKVRLHLLGQAP